METNATSRKGTKPWPSGQGAVTKLEELIAELEKADGPNRDLDWRIAEIFDIPDAWPETASWPPFMAGSKFDKDIPLFTSSLDAAVALVERVLPGAQISLFVGHLTAAKDGSGSRAQVMRGKGPKCPDTGIRWPKLHGECFHAPTPALALCIAVLRAKLAQQEA